jgi:hypothetical protein
MKQLRGHVIAGIIFISLLGTLLHFTYQWSGDSPLVGFFSATNESIWEHTKLFFFPYFLFVLICAPKLAKSYPGYFAAKLIGAFVGIAIIPAAYYTYTAFTGHYIPAVDITIFFVSVVAACLLDRYLLLHTRLKWNRIALLVWVALLILYGVFTFFPPDCPLFEEPL